MVDLILTILILPPYLLKKIGDGVILIFQNIIKKAKIPPTKVVFAPKKPLTLPKISLPSISLPHIRITLPEIKTPPISLKIKYFAIGALFTIIFVFIPYNFYILISSLPNPQTLTIRNIPVTTKIFDRHGSLLYEIYADQNRTPIALSQIPDTIKKATISIEDQDFYRHYGFSARAITRALLVDLQGDKLQGGSTITQQLIKSALLTPERTVVRKIKEIILAFWAERLYTKDEILEMYLNQVPYGGTAWGIEAASETYFAKNVKDLSLAEASLLAGLPAAPTLYSPFGAHPELAKQRQKEVLTRMVEDGYISKKEADQAFKQELQYAPQTTNIKAPHFVMYVKELLEKKYGTRLVEQGGLRVTSSLDLPLQTKAEEIVNKQIVQLQGLRVGNGAILGTNPKTGEILAMVGSKDYFDLEHDGNVNVTTSLRQPGSAIKVVNYAAALERGYTAASILDDSPVSYALPGQPPYSPVNYDGRFHGRIPLRLALANSYNVPAVKVLASLGVTTMIDKGKSMGITSWEGQENRFGLSLTLGGGEVTMLEMAKVYGTLANKGLTTELHPILEVTDYRGSVLENNASGQSSQIISPEVAFILSDILSDNHARSQAFGTNSALNISDKAVAVKTGTTNDKKDNWTIGFTPSYVVVTWVGNNDGTPMHPQLTSGITGAAPIWREMMLTILKNRPNESFLKPNNIVSIPCYGKIEHFVKGTEPKRGCAPLPTLSPTP